MSLKKKILLGITLFLLMFVSWWVNDAINPKLVDESLRDPCSTASIKARGGKPSPFCNN